MLLRSILKDLQSLIGVSVIDNSDGNSSYRANVYAALFGAFVLIAFVILFVYYDPVYYVKPVIFILTLLPIMTVVFVFGCRNRPYICTSLLYLIFTVFFATMSLGFFGRGPGIHYYLLILSLLPVITFTRERWILIYSILIVNFALFIYIELFWEPGPGLLVFPKSPFKIKFATSLILFFSTFAILLIDRQIIAYKQRKMVQLTQELQKKNVELENAIGTKDKFISLIAHDLKGPVGNLSNFLELLSDKLTSLTKDELYDSLYVLKTSSRNTYDLLENLLNWSRIQTGDISFDPVTGDLCTVVSNNIELFRPIALRKGIALEYHPNGPFIAKFDTNMINTVVRNLLNNAIKYTNTGGVIIVSCKKSNDSAEISVKDNGIGIDAETQDKLFKLDAKRYPATGTGGEKGTGLGLIMCNEFIQRHNGKIWAESTFGKGSIFTFSVPLKRPY
jgi:signal transduction histidine kinase